MTKYIVSMLVTPDGAAQKTEYSRQTSRKIANDLTADMQKATDYIIKKETEKQSRISAKEKILAYMQKILQIPPKTDKTSRNPKKNSRKITQEAKRTLKYGS